MFTVPAFEVGGRHPLRARSSPDCEHRRIPHHRARSVAVVARAAAVGEVARHRRPGRGHRAGRAGRADGPVLSAGGDFDRTCGARRDLLLPGRLDRALHVAAVDRRRRNAAWKTDAPHETDTDAPDRRLRTVATATTAAIYLADPVGRDDEAHWCRPRHSGLSVDVRSSAADALGSEDRDPFFPSLRSARRRRSASSRRSRSAWSRRRDRRGFAGPAALLVALAVVQVTLGALTVLSQRDVWINSFHVVCGALVLTTSLVLTLRTWREAFPDETVRLERLDGRDVRLGRTLRRPPAARSWSAGPCALQAASRLGRCAWRSSRREAQAARGRRSGAARTIGRTSARLADYVALTKPRLNLLVVATSAAGYYLGATRALDLWPMAQAVAGTALVAGGAAVLNQVYERDTDALMRRTRARPLPDGRVPPTDARHFRPGAGALRSRVARGARRHARRLAGGGDADRLSRRLHADEAPLVALDAGRRGARGAAAADRLDRVARLIVARAARRCSPSSSSGRFRISWPSRGCIATTTRRRDSRCCRSSSRTGGGRAGRRSSTPRRCCRRASSPRPIGLSGTAYLAIALALGLVLLWLAVRFARARSDDSARTLFLASIAYLPLIWIAMIWDKYVVSSYRAYQLSELRQSQADTASQR